MTVTVLSRAFMSGILSLRVFDSSAKRTRVLTLLLLATIAWGTTAEVTHNHGISVSSVRSLGASEDEIRSACFESSDAETSSNKKSTRDECLICRLHQNLFATALSHALDEAPATSQSQRTSAPFVFRQTQFTTSERGRAPPINL